MNRESRFAHGLERVNDGRVVARLAAAVGDVAVSEDVRRKRVEGEDLSDEVREWIREAVETTVTQFTDSEYAEEWDLDGLVTAMQSLYDTDITVEELREEINVAERDSASQPSSRAITEAMRSA